MRRLSGQQWTGDRSTCTGEANPPRAGADRFAARRLLLSRAGALLVSAPVLAGPLSALGQSTASPAAQGPAGQVAAPGKPVTPVDVGGGRTAARSVLGAGKVRMALILPPSAGPFGRATEAVRDGFVAAQLRDGDTLGAELIEADDSGTDFGRLYRGFIERGIEVVVGPLTRNGLNALVGAPFEPITTVALNRADDERRQPSNVLSLALTIEVEAQQVARLAFGDARARGTRHPAPRAIVFRTGTPLARRAGQAFQEEWLGLGGESTEAIDVEGLPAEDIGLMVRDVRPDVVFLSTSAGAARALRGALPPELPAYGTSMLNVGSALTGQRAFELNGVRLVGMPWTMQPDHPAVMAYPSAPPNYGVELQKLFALGIDGFRVAKALLGGLDAFELDGVTGRLIVERGRGRLERVGVPAEYRSGVPEPL